MPIKCHIEKLIKDRGMTFRDLQKATGISHVGLWKIAKGESNPTLDSIEKICIGLSCDISDLFSLELRKRPYHAQTRGRGKKG